MLLTDLFSQGRYIQESELAEALEQLTDVGQSAWVRNAEKICLIALERYFFLSRHSSDTPNWWLYSNRISVPLNNILHMLMLCQLELMGN